MRFLHLADLHIGKTFGVFSLKKDQEYVFDQVYAYIRQYKPDAVVIAGDVYDKAAPAADSVLVFDAFLTKLAGLGPAVLIISGNHDSPERLGFAGGILKEKNVYMYGVFDGAMRVVSLSDDFGEVRFHMLPFIRPANVRLFYGQGPSNVKNPFGPEPANVRHLFDPGSGPEAPDDQSAHIESYRDAVKAVIESADIDASARNVLIAHQFVASGSADPELSDSERLNAGGIDRVGAEECGMAELFDYVALGHLHGPQRVGAERVRYAGSPMKYSFSECYQKKCALLVDLLEKGDLTVTPLPLKPLHDMRRIRGPLAELLEAGRREAVSSGATGAAADYLHVTLTDEDEIYDVSGKLSAVYEHVLQIVYDNARTNAEPDADGVGAENVGSQSPASLFAEFYVSQNGAELNDMQRKSVACLLSAEADEAGSGGEGEAT